MQAQVSHPSHTPAPDSTRMRQGVAGRSGLDERCSHCKRTGLLASWEAEAIWHWKTQSKRRSRNN
jgi:hypothetical protein